MKERVNNDTKVIASVMKALDVLELVSEHKDGLTVTEISKKLGNGVSATYHLLNTLKKRQYLSQDQVSKKYRIGLQLYLLCAEKPLKDVVIDIAMQYMNKLTDRYDENCNLLSLVDKDVEYIAQTECKQMLRMFTQKGVRVPFYCTGGGKALFAFLTEKQQLELLEDLTFEKFTGNTITSVEELIKETEVIKSTGVAFDREERELGVICIAAPIFNNDEMPVCAISMSCPKIRLNNSKQKDITGSIIEAAREISWKLKAND